MNDHLPARPDDIPMSLLDVAETLGPRVALVLMQHFGGQDLKFPTRPHRDHPVIKALGETDGYALCQFLGGAQIYVPHNRPARSARPHVLALESEGMTRAEIARTLGISERHVRRMANRSDDDDQLSLFD